jgi:tetratricopeptide (TPR) repeat protein
MYAINSPFQNFLARGIITVLIALPALTVQAASADGIEQRYQMSAVANRDHGDDVLAGRYQKAILLNRTYAKLILRNSDPERVFPYPVSTNLCVAHTKIGKLDEAEAYCDAAVKAAEIGAESGHRKDIDYQDEWATALSNRGVLRALSGDEAGARADFASAMLLNSEWKVPAANLARLEVSFDGVAQN